MGKGTDKQYQDAAKKHQRDGEIEIDEGATVSNGDDPGAYVQAWIWIEDDELEGDEVAVESAGDEVGGGDDEA